MIMTVPIQIRNPEVVRDIRQLAELTGETITDVVAEAVRARLADAQRQKAIALPEKVARIREIQNRLAALPKVGEPLTNADLYADDGLPR